MMSRVLLTLLLSFALVAPAFAGDPSTTFKVYDTRDKPVASGTIGVEGKPMLVVFWASYAAESKLALNTIHTLHEAWTRTTGAPVVIISTDDLRGRSRAQTIIEANRWTFASYFDVYKSAASAMGVKDTPTACVLDSERNVVQTFEGFTDGDEAKWEAALKAAK